MERYYSIELIQGKYYIFNKLLMQFEKGSFDTEQEAQEHINVTISICYICD